MGDTVGRFANRIRNGIFSIDGHNTQLPCNAGIHHIHGGNAGFGNQIWNADIIDEGESGSVIFSRISPDGEEGYPGTLQVSVTYTWNNQHILSIHYQAYTDQPTICNLTNHSYFNLGGHDYGTIGDHVIQIFADFIMESDNDLIPTGRILPVENTAFDFREPALMHERLQLQDITPLMQVPGGFDHYYLFNRLSDNTPAVTVWHKESGRRMDMYTNQPGFQFFTACKTNFHSGKSGAYYGKYSGLCLEAQDCANSPNLSSIKCKSFLYPGQYYDRITSYAFSTF